MGVLDKFLNAMKLNDDEDLRVAKAIWMKITMTIMQEEQSEKADFEQQV